MQTASTILLVKPASFGYNVETAQNNVFQQKPEPGQAERITATAIREFENFRKALENSGIRVLVFEDTALPVKPDAIFPNNWITFHPDGLVVLYPLFAPLRRPERRMDIVNALKEKFLVSRVIDLTHFEYEEKYLEGTGSIVFDHSAKVAYACVSPRTHEVVLKDLCEKIGYTYQLFRAYDQNGTLIYHTNVMMCVAEKVAVVCMESIREPHEQDGLRTSLEKSGHRIVPITLNQVKQFAGNMLSVKAKDRDVLVLSQSAFSCLTEHQRQELSTGCRLLPVPITTIETVGGGSVRCMMAEVFLPPRTEGE